MRMASKLFSPEEERKIISDCVKAANNIHTMTKKAYHYLYLCDFFIAHNNQLGFMENYSEPGSLKQDLFSYQKDNQHYNFHPGEENYEYYMQHKKMYNMICDCLKQGIEIKTKRKIDKTKEFDFGM
jgi:hypothetical protein